MDDILEVNSHPMALMQCGDFLQAHPKMKVVEKDDTAGSAQEISHRHLSGHAAICGKLAAEIYNMNILAGRYRNQQTKFHSFSNSCRSFSP